MGGAKNCPETPRQKMIGMMYLVLTAMLALNVSTDILKAFKLVDDTLLSTVSTTENRTKQIMSQFLASRNDNPEKNGPWYDKAAELNRRSDSLYNYIQDIKYHIAVSADGPAKADPEARVIKANDSREAAARYTLPQTGEKPGVVLRNMVEDYRAYLIAMDPAKESEFNTLFDTSDKQQKDGSMLSWENQMFLDMPAGAAVVLMTKLQNDVRNAENTMVQYLRGQTDAGDLRVNKYSAYVIPKSDYVIRGGKYSATIIMAAVDSTQTPSYFVEGQRINDDGLYEVPASSLGTKKFSGWVEFTNPNSGETTQLPFNHEYSVGEPAVTMSNVELNVMYEGYDNKFSISVPGISNDKVKVSVSGAQVHQQSGLWLIKPAVGAKNVTITVSAELDGRMQTMGTETYRIKPLPKPGAYLKSGSNEYNGDKTIPRSAIINPNSTIIASYGPEGLLNLNFTITSFKADINGMLTQATGNKFTREQLERISKLKPGNSVILKDIRAKGPGGQELTLAAVPLTLN